MGRTVWFPGHMAKGKRQLEALAGMLDIILEVRDARAPRLTASPMIEELARSLPVWTILSKADIADPAVTRQWILHFKKSDCRVWALDLRKNLPGDLVKTLQAVAPSSSSKHAYRETRVAVVGTPNVGKSSLLNKLVGRHAAAVGAIPGVTRGVAWFKGKNCLIVDSPGILDPHSDPRAHRMLSWISSTRGQVIGSWQVLACECFTFLRNHGLESCLQQTWGIDVAGDSDAVLERVGRRLGRLLPGGVVDMETAGRMMIEALSAGKLGRISLEAPDSPLPWSELQ